MPKKFNEFIERKIPNKTLYRHTFTGNDICNNCIYHRPYLPCEECLNYQIQKCDIQYYINSYKEKFPNREINIIDEIFKMWK